ncbi:MAG: sn-glycerol-3-phosphate ABC transporter ATP-binding protein UgpC [Nocardioidaceae bacterium]|nr:sn-glycerol-3-phosphate ABC transporter ATP-binding protein UgpC [Nocardioidaceae bacterium]MCL2613121.1 sn-glycerol-3-phosphate ABC transporter ATP-binding protein UgpC [Nocardioidaceae bacterium]
MAKIELRRVGKVYADGTRAVTDLSMSVEDGEFLVFVGPSGCGKTTALRMIAGLETISEGEVAIGDRVVNNVPPRDRDLAMVFQSYALYPHLTVRDNIGFGLELRKVPKAERNKRVEDAARLLGLADYLDRKPRNLSGGQRQRVAMGRAIVREPQAFLMDEPLSNLDAKLRVQMRAEIGALQRDLGVTTIYVTHDQTEAMTLGHRVAVMKLGVLQQIAPPQVLYDKPDNLFVAGFIGSPAMNFATGTLRRSDGGYAVQLGSATLALPDATAQARPGLAAYVDEELVIGLRPEDIDDADLAAAGGGATMTGTVELLEPLGSDVMVHVATDAPPVRDSEDIRELGKETEAGGPLAGRTLVVARFNPRSKVRIGDEVTMALDTERLHFFDPETGSSIWDGTSSTTTSEGS